MICQLQHQFKDGHTEVKAQREFIPELGMTEQLHQWIKNIVMEFPLPKDAIWVIGNEKWEHFVWNHVTAQTKADADKASYSSLEQKISIINDQLTKSGKINEEDQKQL